MQIPRLAAILLSFTTLIAAGPLLRDRRNGALRMRFENSTSSALASETALEVIPVPFSSLVTFETEKTTTIERTSLIPIFSTQTPSPASQTSSPLLSFTTSGSSSSIASTRFSGSDNVATSVTSSVRTISASSETTLQISSSPIISTNSIPANTSLPFISDNNTGFSSSSTRTEIAFTSSPLTLASQGGATLLSSPTISSTQEFPFVTNITSQTTPLQTSGVVSLVTDTYASVGTALTSQIIKPSPSGSSLTLQSNSVITIATSTISPSSLQGPTSRGTRSGGDTITISSTSPPSIVSASSLTQIPTVISSVPPASTSISATAFADNLALAKGYNALFSSLNPSSQCTSGSIACIDSQTANCGSSSSYILSTCEQGSSCFAIPMNTTDGVYVGCFNTKTAESILGIANVNSIAVSTQSAQGPVSTIFSKSSTSTPTKLAPQTFNTASVTIPTADPGVVIPTKSSVLVSSSVAPSIAFEPSDPETSTTTVKVHQTSTMIIYITPSSVPGPAQSSTIPPVASKTIPAAGGAGGSTTSPAGSLITIIPVNPNELLPVTVTVTATVTTTEKIRE